MLRALDGAGAPALAFLADDGGVFRSSFLRVLSIFCSLRGVRTRCADVCPKTDARGDSSVGVGTLVVSRKRFCDIFGETESQKHTKRAGRERQVETAFLGLCGV